MHGLTSNWTLPAVSSLTAASLVFLRVKDHAEGLQDLKGTNIVSNAAAAGDVEAKPVTKLIC